MIPRSSCARRGTRLSTFSRSVTLKKTMTGGGVGAGKVKGEIGGDVTIIEA
jgi:hypothetical protein